MNFERERKRSRRVSFAEEIHTVRLFEKDADAHGHHGSQDDQDPAERLYELERGINAAHGNGTPEQGSQGDPSEPNFYGEDMTPSSGCVSMQEGGTTMVAHATDLDMQEDTGRLHSLGLGDLVDGFSGDEYEPPVHKAARGMDEWERHEQQQDTTGSMRMYAGGHPDDSPPHWARTPAAAPNDFQVYQDSPEAGAEVSPEHGIRDQDVTNDVDSRDSWQPGEDDTVLEDVDIELDSIMAKLPANADPLEATNMVAAFAASSTGTASLQSDFPDSSAGGAATPEQGRDREHGHSLDNSPHSQLLAESEEQSPADSGGRPMVRSTFLRV